ncbi:MAG: response regulator [Phycisphaerae bacterium]|nr:response regulator [Phycisphaerae bacterium]HON89995.1 response regulator [Sedimentisphaerales bacterium]
MANKVLVADDELHIIHVVAIKLRNNGYEVITAGNGAEAYELACRERPDIVVTDYQMPLMTGIELIEKMRADDRTCNTPVILLTARSFAIPEEMQQNLRVSSCLSKPFSPKELLKTIQDLLYQPELVAQS